MASNLARLTGYRIDRIRYTGVSVGASALSLTVLLLVLGTSRAESVVDQHPPVVVRWDSVVELPVAIGLGGPFVGTHAGALLVAGAANFPAGPPWGDPPGKKVCHKRIFVLTDPNSEWRHVVNLPKRTAYGASVSTDQGVLLIGGENDGEPLADVYAVQWNARQRQVAIETLSPRPVPASYLVAGRVASTIYVAASYRQPGDDRLSHKAFWSLNTSDRAGVATWRELPTWPGPPRRKAVAATQSNANGDTCLYQFSGERPRFRLSGEPDLARFAYLDDAYRYDPVSVQWTRISNLPTIDDDHRIVRREAKARRRPVAAAQAMGVGDRYVLVFGGVTRRHIQEPIEQRPACPRDVLCYDTQRDEWTVVAEPMPIGVVTTNAVRWGGGIVIPTGETKPGVRTPRVQRAVIQVADVTSASVRDGAALNIGGDRDRATRGPDMTFGWLNWSALLAYLGVMLTIGIYTSRREASTEQFFLAGRRIPWWAAGLSVFGTQLSAITFMAIPATAYQENWVRSIGAITLLVVLPLVIWFYLPIFRRVNATTAYEYLEQRFNATLRIVASIVWMLFQLGRMGVVLYLPAIALSAATGIDIFLSIALMGLLATAYTALGGIEAVIWTDVIQVVVLLGGALLCIAVVIARIGGIEPFLATVAAADKITIIVPGWDASQMVLWVMIVGTFFVNLVPYTSDQAVVQRYLTTLDTRQAARSLWVNVALTIPVALLFYGLGSALHAFYQTHTARATPSDADLIVPWFVVRELAPGIAGLVIAAIFAAAMSSLDSAMNSVATVIITDLYRPFRKGVSDLHCLQLARGITILLGCAGTAIAVAMASADIKLLFDYFNTLLGLFGGPLVGLFFLAIFTTRTHSFAALFGLLTGFIITVVVAFGTEINFFLYAAVGTCSSVAIGYLTSLLVAGRAKDLTGLTIHTQQRLPEQSHSASLTLSD